MSSQKEALVESRDFWRESARHDRKQFLASFAMAAAGLTLAGVGISTMASGDIAGGALEFVIGGGYAAAFTKTGLDEVQDFADMTALTAVRQSQINELGES